MRPVRRAEGVVDVHVREGGQLLGEAGIVGFLFRMEPHIFQEQDPAGLEGPRGLLGRRANAVRGGGHRLAE